MANQNSKDRIENIAIYAKDKNDVALEAYPERSARLKYRWEHTLRVAQYGKRLAKLEGADVEIVVAASLLHDIAKLSHEATDFNHGRIGAEMVRPFLKKLDYAEKDVENICYSIASHVDGKADFEHPLTLEAQIVSDADKIDRLSTYRTELALQDSINEAYEDFIYGVAQRLKQFQKAHKKWFIQTKSGKKAFEKQLSVQIAYMERLIADYEITTLPEL